MRELSSTINTIFRYKFMKLVSITGYSRFLTIIINDGNYLLNYKK